MMFVRPSRMQLIVVIGAIAYALTFAVAVRALWRGPSVGQWVGWGGSGYGPLIVLSIDPAGPAAGRLKIGDRIVALDGDSQFSGAYTPLVKLRQYAPSSAYTLKVIRTGREREIPLLLGTLPSRPLSRSISPFVYVYLFGSVGFFATGMLMGWKRPEFRTAQLGWWACLLTAFFYLSYHFSGPPGTVRLPWAVPLFPPWHFFAVYCFVASFPFPVPETRSWRWFRVALIPLCAFEWMRYITWGWFPWTKRLLIVYPPGLLTTFNLANSLIASAVAIGVIAVMIRNYRMSRSPADRRRIEIVAGAIAVGLGIATSTTIFNAVEGGRLGSYVLSLGNLAPLPIPFCFYYAVVAHQVLDIRLVVRRGLQYLLAQQVLRILTLLPLAAIMIRALRNPNAPMGSLLNLTGIALVAAAAMCLEFRDTIQAAVDRWFFRERFDREKLVRELLGEIARSGSFDGVVAAARARLKAIYVPEFVEVAVVQAGDPGGFPNTAALRIPFSGPSGKITGWLSLGLRKSEESYTSGDMELLDLVASQIGLMGENLLLASESKDAVREERTRLARELHDTMSQGFVGISIYLEAAQKSMAGSPEQAGVFLEVARKLATDSAQETRNSLKDLRAQSGLGSHLEFRLRALAHRAGQGAGPVISLDVPAELCDLASDDEGWHLARVAEEAVTNAYKHARATHIGIALSVDGRQLVLRVQDDGTGFETTRPVNGFGVRGMRERMGSLHGTVEIHSAPGKGTEVRAMVPLSTRESKLAPAGATA